MWHSLVVPLNILKVYIKIVKQHTPKRKPPKPQSLPFLLFNDKNKFYFKGSSGRCCCGPGKKVSSIPRWVVCVEKDAVPCLPLLAVRCQYREGMTTGAFRRGNLLGVLERIFQWIEYLEAKRRETIELLRLNRTDARSCSPWCRV